MGLRCLYASKPCTNLRDRKINGELHRLCFIHRARANESQRRWHSRERGPRTKANRPRLQSIGRKAQRLPERRATLIEHPQAQAVQDGNGIDPVVSLFPSSLGPPLLVGHHQRGDSDLHNGDIEALCELFHPEHDLHAQPAASTEAGHDENR